MAKTKQSGKTRQHTTRPGKRYGLKISGGQPVKTGMILVRQKGTKVHPGAGVGQGRDHTLFALYPGTVEYQTRLGKKIVNIKPA